MSRFVIDANIAVKWVVAEPDSHLALALTDHDFAAPDLLICEVSNILWKKAQRGEVSLAQVQTAIDAILAADLPLQHSSGLLERATQLAIQLAHLAYDCFYLALAEQENCPLITTDQRLLRLADSLPSIQVLSLAQAAA